MFLVWAWTKLGFLSEFALRAVNLPFLVMGALALRQVRFWPLVYLSSPFVLYYVGELRPYAMQVAAGALMAAALGLMGRERRESGYRGVHALGFAALLLVCSSLTAAVWAAGAGLSLLVLRPEWLKERGFWFRILPWLIGGLAMGGYYGFTLLEGYRATGFEKGGVLSVGFGFYELLGLLGLGPGKNDLRSGLEHLWPYWPVLVPAFLVLATAWGLGVWRWFQVTPRRLV
ncbi:MAG: hypothetical protein ACQKBU_00005, partial [Verrucomicrobiales bacterium]